MGRCGQNLCPWVDITLIWTGPKPCDLDVLLAANAWQCTAPGAKRQEAFSFSSSARDIQAFQPGLRAIRGGSRWRYGSQGLPDATCKPTVSVVYAQYRAARSFYTNAATIACTGCQRVGGPSAQEATKRQCRLLGGELKDRCTRSYFSIRPSRMSAHYAVKLFSSPE